MLLALLAACLLQTPPTYTEIQARIPKTPWVVLLQLQGWKEGPQESPLRKEFGGKVVFDGTLEPSGTILTLIAEANTKLISPAAWRKRFAVPGQEFECQLSACVDASLNTPGAPLYSDFHAYTCGAGYCLDLHVSRLEPNDKPVLVRAEFERIVKSMRILLLRRGWAEDYPDAVGYQMTLAALAGPDRAGWKEGYLPKHSGEWTVHFVEAEFLRSERAPATEQIAAYERALALLAKLEKPDPKEQFGWAIACDGLGLALFDAKRHADALAPLEKGAAMLVALGRQERAPLYYNLSCAQALLGHAQPSLSALQQAIEADERYRERAAKDADFAALRDSAEFQKLVAKPAPAK